MPSMMQGFYIDNGYLNVQDISTIQWLYFVRIIHQISIQIISIVYMD